MNLDDAENKLYNSEEITKPVKLFTLSEADKMNKYTFKPFDYDVRSDFSKGVSVGVGELSDIPQEVVLFGKRARLALGGYFGDTPEEFENKKVNLITAERNLLEAKQNRMLKNKVSPEASESLSFSIGSNIPTFATMLLGAGAAYRGVRAISTAETAISAAGKIGLAENFLFEGASEVAKKTPTVSKTDERIKTGEARAGELNVDKITKEWAVKSTLDVPLYAAVSTYLEAKVGFGEQLNIWNTPIKLSGTTKNIVARALAKTGLTAASEGTTETLQSLSSTGINLIDGNITPKDLPEELQEAVMSGIVGGIMGTASGGSVSLKQARNAISMIRQQVEPVVGKENAQVVAESLFNDASTDLSNIVTRELELDSQLRNKHGNIWNSMLTAVTKEMEGKPRFEGWSEDQKAHYANTVAKHFADQTLAEANFRGTTLDAILRASDITWDNGIRLARHINLFDALKNPEMIPAQAKLKRESLLAFLKRNGGLQDYGGELKSRDAQKLYPGIVNKNGMNFDDAALMAWENGYFPSKTERPDINEFLEAVDEGLRGNNRYNTEEGRNFSDAIEDLREELDRLGIDYENMTAAEIEKAVDEILEMKSLEREAAFYNQYESEIGLSEDEAERLAIETEGKKYPIIKDKDLPEYYQIAEENAQLDAENPAYEGETITINGKERTVYNSNGDRIAKSKEALENFYKWFGDSKVVDEQGRPLVVYHRTLDLFNAFSKEKIGARFSSDERGFFFVDKENIAKDYATSEFDSARQGYIMPLYISASNPLIVNSEYARKNGLGSTVFDREDSISFWDNYQNFALEEVDKNKNDGVIIDDGNFKMVVAFNPNQIKSTQNRGTYSESDNIYYQTREDTIPTSEFYDKIKESSRYQNNIKYTEDVFNTIKADEHVVSADISQSINRVGGQSTYIEGIFDNRVNFLIRISDHDSNYDLSDISVGYGIDKNKIMELLEYIRGSLDRAKEKERQQHIYYSELLKDIIPESYYQYANSKETLKDLVKQGVIERSDYMFSFNLEQQKKYGRKGISWKDIENFVKKKGEWSEDSENIYYQSAYVSMKGELEGEYLDADRFEGTGEGNAAHGWGNYLLKSREINKAHYYDWMSEEKVFYDGVEVMQHDDMPIRYAAREFAYAKDIEEAKKNIEEAISKAQVDITKEEEHIKNMGKEYGVSEEEIELLKQLKDINDSFYELSIIDANGAKLMQKEAERKLSENAKDKQDYFYMAFDNLDSYKRRYNGYKEALELDFSKFEKKETGAQYEADVPEDEYLLDENKKFNEQSNIVKDAVRKIADEMGGRLNERKLRDLTNDGPVGSGSENFKTYYAKRAWRAGKDYAISDIHNNHEGEQEKELTDFIKNLDFDAISDKRDFSDYFGDEIYRELDNFYGSQKAASKKLEEFGVKGIKYDGQRDGIGYVIFKGADAPIIQRLLQRGKNEKGYTKITPDEYIIKLLESADESTLPHEFAHYWLTEMWNYTRTGRASENYMKRWNIISDYLGIKPEQTRLTRDQQEKFASSYEAYLTRGELPTPLIGSAFDDYDKWLQRVYSDYNKINYQSGYGKRRVRLTDAAIKFFQSMTTGNLEVPALAPKNTGVEVPQTVSAEEVIKPTNEVVETPTTYDTTRVINITEGQKGVSKVYQREAMKHADRIVDELGVSYNKINLEEQAVKATEWVQNNLEEARKVVNGAPAPEGIIDTAIFIAYENEMLRIGNNAEYQRALKIHSQVQTQRGQAIAAERITTDDVYNPAYWWKKLQNSQETNVARKLFKGDTDALNQVVETETKNLMKQIAGKPRDEQVKALSNLAKKLQKDYNLDTLYQMPDEVNERTVKEFVKDVFGINPDLITGNEVINKAEQLQKLWDNTKDESGNPSIEAMRAKRELNDLIQAKNPSSTLAIWTSIFGRGVMLMSLKSPVLNVISNIEAGLTEGITRRIMYKTTEKAVDANVKKEFSNYAWKVYKASGDIVSTMNNYDDDMRVIGEQILHSQGQGALRAASRKVEEVSFKYLMGAADAVSKTLAFNDTADLLATKIAREEGAKDISKRATEIYKDAILIRPKTEQGKLVRQKAQEQAHYTTFTNDSWAAKFGLSARNWLNMVGRNKVRLGDLTMKFVKTPANVQMMGLEYGFGSLYTLYNVQEIIKNPQSEVSQHAIRAAVRNGLGIALAALLYSMLDPEDYFSEFDTLNPKEKDKMRALGAMPNSIKIGNRWVSLDYFGQIAIPLVGMLEARRNNGLRSYIQSGLTQAAKIPGIKETKQLIDTMSEYARYDLKPEKIVQMMAGTVLDQARAMTIPAIVNDIAKMTDDYERDTMGGVFDKVFASIPGLRQTLPERYGIQGLVRTEPALSTLLFGSRVKTEQSDKLVREVEKLAGKAEQPSISDVTKYGDLRLLSPEKKVRVRKEFYKLYNSESKKLISTREYRKKAPEEQKKALNKVRNRVVKSLKEKYSNDIKREKRRQ